MRVTEVWAELPAYARGREVTKTFEPTTCVPSSVPIGADERFASRRSRVAIFLAVSKRTRSDRRLNRGRLAPSGGREVSVPTSAMHTTRVVSFDTVHVRVGKCALMTG